MSLEVSLAEGILRVTLNRPERLNAIDAALAQALRETIDRAAGDDAVRVVLLRGAGRAFCAGQDLADPGVAPGADLGATIERSYNPLIRAMRSLPKPIVAGVHGVAAGAGANLAFAADIVVAARSASFIESFSKIGLLPDSGGTWMLPRLVGFARAVGWAMLGDRVSAEQAYAWGAIWSVVDDTELEGACASIAQSLALAPTRALGAVKNAMEAHASVTLERALEGERDLQRMLGATRDFREGVEAFASKRAPQFEGR